MDKEEPTKKRWDWLPAFMPGVAKLVRERRAQLGDAHVDECWKRGVVEQQPGWFFAVEGAIAIGTPAGDEQVAWYASNRFMPRQALLYIRTPGD